jgi:hypothetical protein
MPMTPMLTTPTVRDMLLMGGVGQYNAVLSIPYMFFMARTTEPYAQGVQQLIKGLQRLLNKRGASLKVDGGLARDARRAQEVRGPEVVRQDLVQALPGGHRRQAVAGLDPRGTAAGESEPDRRGGGGHGSGVLADRAAAAHLVARCDLVHRRYVRDAPAVGRRGRPGAVVLRLEAEPAEVTYQPAYAELGADATGVPWYCSVATPQGGCTPIANVAKPMNAATLDLFNNIQRAINALLAKRGKTLIGVDGRIGPATVSALKSLQTSPSQIALDVESVAKYSPEVYAELQNRMTTEGAALVADPRSSSPPTVAIGGSVVSPSDAAIKASLPQMSTQTMLILAAVAIGGGVALFGKKRPRRARRRR